jgi:hypothetical protein
VPTSLPRFERAHHLPRAQLDELIATDNKGNPLAERPIPKK